MVSDEKNTIQYQIRSTILNLSIKYIHLILLKYTNR